MVEREQILTAYRVLLGREPESAAVLDFMCSKADLNEVAMVLMGSAEFRRRASVGHLSAHAERWVCAEIRDGLRLWVNLMDLGVGAGALRDDWEPAETKFILSELQSGSCFVDVGANIGWFAVLAAHRVGPSGHVAAFEPRADLYRRLRDSVAANGFLDRCSLHDIALGETDSEMEIASVPDELNPGHSFLVRERLQVGAVSWGKVPVRPLDGFDFGRPLDLIKVDVEGAEAMVLSGAQALLRRDKPILIAELFPEWLRKVSRVEPEAYLSMLRDLGYRIHELTADGPGRRLDGLPAAAAEAGFFINIVACCEARPFRTHLPAPPVRVTPADRVADVSLESLSRQLQALDVRVHALHSRLEVPNELKARLDQAQAAARRNEESLGGMQDSLVRAVATMQDSVPAHVVVAQAVQPVLQQVQDLKNRIGTLTEEVRRRRKPLASRIFRELKKPFTRRFWERQREKRMLRKLAGIGSRAPAPAKLTTWADVQIARAKVPALAGVEKPVAMIIDDRLPEPDRDSGSIDAVNMVRGLVAAGYHVVFAVHPKREQIARYTTEIEELGARRMRDNDAPSVQAFVEQHGVHVDLFVLSRVSAGGLFLELIRYNCPHAKIVFNTVDLHHIREARAARLSGDEAALARAGRTRDREEFLAGKADMTLVVSSVEEEILQASVPGCATAVLPLSRAVRHPRIPFEKRAGIGFIGGFQHAPNIDAISYFLREVWPLVHTRDPNIALEIVGSDLPPDVLEAAQGKVHYLGALPQVEGWFDRLRMTVAPLRIGAGAKGKIASSLCNGVPCVISPIAAEGMNLIHGHDVLVANTPEAMAEQIVRLHTDPDLWSRLAAAAEELAEARLSSHNFDRILRETLIRMEMPVAAATPRIKVAKETHDEHRVEVR